MEKNKLLFLFWPGRHCWEESFRILLVYAARSLDQGIYRTSIRELYWLSFNIYKHSSRYRHKNALHAISSPVRSHRSVWIGSTNEITKFEKDTIEFNHLSFLCVFRTLIIHGIRLKKKSYRTIFLHINILELGICLQSFVLIYKLIIHNWKKKSEAGWSELLRNVSSVLHSSSGIKWFKYSANREKA